MPTRLLIAVAIAATSFAIWPNEFEPGAKILAKDLNTCMAKCQAKGRPFKACVQICG